MVSHSGSPGLPLPWCPELQGCVASCLCPMEWQDFGGTTGTLGSQDFSLMPPGPTKEPLPHEWGTAPPSGSSCRTRPTPPPPQHTSCLQPFLDESSRVLSGLCSPVMACDFRRARSWGILGQGPSTPKPWQNSGRSPLPQASPFLGQLLALPPLALSSSSLVASVGQIPS